MINYLIVAVGVFTLVIGIGRLVLIGQAYFRERNNVSDSEEFDRERELTISIMSVTAIIAGLILIYIGLFLEGILIV